MFYFRVWLFAFFLSFKINSGFKHFLFFRSRCIVGQRLELKWIRKRQSLYFSKWNIFKRIAKSFHQRAYHSVLFLNLFTHSEVTLKTPYRFDKNKMIQLLVRRLATKVDLWKADTVTSARQLTVATFDSLVTRLAASADAAPVYTVTVAFSAAVATTLSAILPVSPLTASCWLKHHSTYMYVYRTAVTEKKQRSRLINLAECRM